MIRIKRFESINHDFDSMYRDYPNMDKADVKKTQRTQETRKPEPKNDIDILTAIKNGDREEIIFNYNNDIYKWISNLGLFGEGNKKVENKYIENRIKSMKPDILFINIL